jgi:hypothetical protein
MSVNYYIEERVENDSYAEFCRVENKGGIDLSAKTDSAARKEAKRVAAENG